MNPGKFVVASALLIPALMFVSCKDTNENPIAPSTPQTPTTQGGRGVDPAKVRFPAIADADLAQAAKEDATAESAEAGFTTLHDDLAPHDFAPAAMLVQCIDGDEGTGDPTFNGEATRFRNGRGCELNTHDGDAIPNNNAAFVITTVNRIRGKLLTAVDRLDFFYAGGPSTGGNPRFSIPIDECEAVDVATSHTTNCPPGQSTDGHWDHFAFVAADRCNDGDPNVGAIKAEDDPDCIIDYDDGTFYPNWTAFETAKPGARIATDAVPFIALDWENQHYLIYRVTIR